MDCLFEILFQLLAEFFLGAGLEIIAEGIGRLIAWLFSPLSEQANDDARRDEHLNVGRAVLWQLVGVAAGFVSLLILPRAIIHVTALHVLNLIVTPLLMATVMVKWGDVMARHQRGRTPLNHFVCAYGFALCYLLVRFFFAK
jgi:hypothetical protein